MRWPIIVTLAIWGVLCAIALVVLHWPEKREARYGSRVETMAGVQVDRGRTYLDRGYGKRRELVHVVRKVAYEKELPLAVEHEVWLALYDYQEAVFAVEDVRSAMFERAVERADLVYGPDPATPEQWTAKQW